MQKVLSSLTITQISELSLNIKARTPSLAFIPVRFQSCVVSLVFLYKEGSNGKIRNRFGVVLDTYLFGNPCALLQFMLFRSTL